MTAILTAQNTFNAPGFDDSMMLSKAERELSRLSPARGMEPYDHMFNFAVTLAALCDWTYHVRLSKLPRWAGKKEHHFTNWVRHTNQDAFVFIDLSNEFKHANRVTPSTLAEKMMLAFIDLVKHPHLRSTCDLSKGWIQNMGGNDWYFFPSVKFNGKTENFHDPATRAIAWWKLFDPAVAQPMDVKGNIVP